MNINFGTIHGPMVAMIPDQWQAVTCDMTGGQTRAVFTMPTGFKEGSIVVPFVRFYGKGDITYTAQGRVMEPGFIDDALYTCKMTEHYPINKLHEMKLKFIETSGKCPSIEIRLSRFPWPLIRPICFGLYYLTDKFGSEAKP